MRKPLDRPNYANKGGIFLRRTNFYRDCGLLGSFLLSLELYLLKTDLLWRANPIGRVDKNALSSKKSNKIFTTKNNEKVKSSRYPIGGVGVSKVVMGFLNKTGGNLEYSIVDGRIVAEVTWQ